MELILKNLSVLLVFATTFAGVLPSIFCASLPICMIFPVSRRTATTDGSFKAISLPLTETRTVDVPRSIPISLLIFTRFPRFCTKMCTHIILYMTAGRIATPEKNFSSPDPFVRDPLA